MMGAPAAMSTSAVLWPCGTKLFSVRPSGNLVPAGRPKSLTTIATLSRALSLMVRGSWFATTCWFMLAPFLSTRRVGKAKRAHRLSSRSDLSVGTALCAFAHPTDLRFRHCERSEAIQGREGSPGLLRRCAPRNDAHHRREAHTG